MLGTSLLRKHIFGGHLKMCLSIFKIIKLCGHKEISQLQLSKECMHVE